MTLSSNYIINVMIAGSLHQLWALINSQQIIVLFPLYRISMPANAGIYFNVLMQVAAFDFFDTDEWYYDMKMGYEIEPHSPNFGVMGFDSIWFMNNMGSMGMIITFATVIYFIQPLTSCCKSNDRL